jgi:hypothetical protein
MVGLSFTENKKYIIIFVQGNTVFAWNDVYDRSPKQLSLSKGKVKQNN